MFSFLLSDDSTTSIAHHQPSLGCTLRYCAQMSSDPIWPRRYNWGPAVLYGCVGFIFCGLDEQRNKNHTTTTEECVTDRCSRYPCQHGGKCLPSDDGAICLCPLGFGGDLCEMRLDLQVRYFINVIVFVLPLKK